MVAYPDPTLPLYVWIGVFGKALVKKGVLTREEVIAELNDAKSPLDNSNPITAATLAEIENMIATVQTW